MQLEEIKDKVASKQDLILKIREEIAKVIVGQKNMVDKILIGLFTGGHILLEGVPGLAKSLTVSTVSKIAGVSFQRIQFTPDLLPADILGTVIYYQKTGEFITKKGPLFHNIILADEINRAPAKVQSALLEAMQEKQVTISETTYALETPFLVLATQNPLEQEGTYPLPEAQQDRFMMKVKIEYPSKEEEKEILKRISKQGKLDDISVNAVLSKEELASFKEIISNIYIDEKLEDYIIDVIFKTRDLPKYIEAGASPRATINLLAASKAKAFLEGRAFVTPDDIKAMVFDILRHRIVLTYEAEAEGHSVESLISYILDNTLLP